MKTLLFVAALAVAVFGWVDGAKACGHARAVVAVQVHAVAVQPVVAVQAVAVAPVHAVAVQKVVKERVVVRRRLIRH